MRDTLWNGGVQKMVLPNGRAKGIKLVLQEPGVDMSDMNAEKLRQN